MKIRAKFFKMKNEDGELYATVEIIHPKKYNFEGCSVDTTRISEYSKVHPIHVGEEQLRRDSLYVDRGLERIWKTGHLGYFELDDEDVYNCLTPEEKSKYHLENLEFFVAFPVAKYMDESHIFVLVPTTKNIDMLCDATNDDIMKVYKLRETYGEIIEPHATEHELMLSKNIKKFLIEVAEGRVIQRDNKYFDIL